MVGMKFERGVMNSFRLIAGLFFAGLTVTPISGFTDIGARIDAIRGGDHRDEGNGQRDRHRHPRATLEFLDVQPEMTVVEIWPARGWYTEILAPFLADSGKLYVAGFGENPAGPPYLAEVERNFRAKLAARPDVYRGVVVTELAPPSAVEIAPASSADRVLTFRNVHNWMKGGIAEDVFAAMYRALKPGGVLGVVEHRAEPGTSVESMIESGYVTEGHVISLAEQAGFQFDSSSEINANPKDTKDHPRGVWTLPPTLRMGDEDRQRYLDIGESDRMTLRFVKPDNKN
jgi:predicted methyltransferase